MKSNAKGSEFTRLRSVSLAEQMALYDGLPARWRQLIGSLPVPQDVKDVYLLVQKYGEPEAWRLIIQVFEERYPGWHPLEALQESADA